MIIILVIILFTYNLSFYQLPCNLFKLVDKCRSYSFCSLLFIYCQELNSTFPLFIAARMRYSFASMVFISVQLIFDARSRLIFSLNLCFFLLICPFSCFQFSFSLVILQFTSFDCKLSFVHWEKLSPNYIPWSIRSAFCYVHVDVDYLLLRFP